MSKAAVIYWSGTGNTEAMANAIVESLKGAGEPVDLFNVDDITADMAAGYDHLALGCPSMGGEELEDMSFEPFFTALEQKLSGKKVALFGSYGWGDGEWMRIWQERTINSGASLFEEGLIINDTPDANGLAECAAFGSRFAAF
jgi:flavodoxin short chain